MYSNQSINCLSKEKTVVIKQTKYPKVFIDYLQTTDDVYENLEDYNAAKKRKVLIVFHDVIEVIEANTKFTDLFLKGRKLNISLNLISESSQKGPLLVCREYRYEFIVLHRAHLRLLVSIQRYFSVLIKL